MSPVGLLSLAFAGRDPVVLARGARAALQACLGERSPALAYAAVLHRFYQAGRRIAVFWPYAETLWGVALWWRQLLAESLGKRRDLDGHEIRVGPCPLPALGVSDQHSVHQLFMEGPDDKWFSFVELARFRKDVAIPELYPDRPALAYLGGKSFATLMHAERRGTQHALQQAGRPCALITVPELDEHTLGELLMMLEMAISFAGKLFHLDPYDQPGVEAGKRASWALLGREGAGEAAGIEQALAPDPAWCFPAEPGA
ncbi:MAG: hypothetical protein KatS3mg102_0919 [Planctomycetota bacterium]|nr:MAG: hypothetical protein KatS3mg102_0919 [Planctomycetota bacterium]